MKYIIILTMIVLAIISIMMLSGKGEIFLKSNDRDSGKYNSRLLARVTGIALLLVIIALSLQFFMEDSIPPTLPLVFVIVAVLGLWIARYTICKNKDYMPQQKVETNTKMNKFKVVGSVIGTIAIGIFVVVIMFVGSIRVDMNKSTVTFGATLWTSKTIKYNEIKSIQIENKLESSNRTGGVSNTKIDAGNFKNDDLGKYHRYTYGSCDTYIIIKMKNDLIIVVNDKTKKDTKQLYKKLEERLP